MVPFSAAISDLLRRAIAEDDATGQKSIREIIREEIAIAIPTKKHTRIKPDPEKWYSIQEVRSFLNQDLPIGTQSSQVSRGIGVGWLVTNGKKRKACLIYGRSIIDWLAKKKDDEK